MAKLKITETVLRDAHQSLIATRMTTAEILPIVSKLDDIGFHSLEAWGGATFDACLRFLNEDPWDRLRQIKERAKKTKIQMLFRGQNILGYKNYADDVVEYFVQKSIANGVDIIRIFDALNDVRNLQTAINATKKESGHVQATVCYTISPFHNIKTFVDMAKRLEDNGADSIAIKDMAGLLLPYVAFELITEMKKAIKIPIQLHTHYTSGVGSMTYLKAIEAGVDIVDTAMSPLALGTSQPATEPLVATLEGTERETGLSLKKLSKIAKYFTRLREKYIAEGLLDPKVLGVDVNTLLYQVPGGMLSNLLAQMKEQKMEEKFGEILKEIPRVRKDFGYPPLVTPTSQVTGAQAALNVITGERYKVVAKETRALVKGEYGHTPMKISDEFAKKIIGGTPRITCRPANLIKPQLPKFRREAGEYIEQEEDILTYALFEDVALKFFQKRIASRSKEATSSADPMSKSLAHVFDKRRKKANKRKKGETK